MARLVERPRKGRTLKPQLALTADAKTIDRWRSTGPHHHASADNMDLGTGQMQWAQKE